MTSLSLADNDHSPAAKSTGIPPWGHADLPEPAPLGCRNWASFIGPGIVMMGIQIGGGEWLLGPEVTARYGGGLMWIATVAIILQVFYNIECGRYALFAASRFLRGLCVAVQDPCLDDADADAECVVAGPGLSTHGAAMIASLWLDRPVTPADQW